MASTSVTCYAAGLRGTGGGGRSTGASYITQDPPGGLGHRAPAGMNPTAHFQFEMFLSLGATRLYTSKRERETKKESYPYPRLPLDE